MVWVCRSWSHCRRRKERLRRLNGGHCTCRVVKCHRCQGLWVTWHNRSVTRGFRAVQVSGHGDGLRACNRQGIDRYVHCDRD